MKAYLFRCLIVCLIPILSQGADIAQESPRLREERMQWWLEARFGMFVHWGLYSLAARHEWVQNHERISTESYQVYFDHFDPDLYNPQEWAKAAKSAGMRYFVITAKHHDGFCLWDTKFTDYKVTNTPYGKDLIAPMVEAFRSEGLRVGLYYSLLDWHHPDYTVDCCHPMRDNQEERAKNQDRDMRRYVDYVGEQNQTWRYTGYTCPSLRQAVQGISL